MGRSSEFIFREHLDTGFLWGRCYTSTCIELYNAEETPRSGKEQRPWFKHVARNAASFDFQICLLAIQAKYLRVNAMTRENLIFFAGCKTQLAGAYRFIKQKL